MADVLFRARELARRGYKEVVLTGVHVGWYGRDLGQGTDLAALLEELCTALPHVRFRLTSLECTEVTQRLVAAIKKYPQICRHFHIPLQSGSDRILSCMQRPYLAQDFIACVEELRANFPQASIGVDVIVGYPGETDEDFAHTLRVVREAPVTYLHVFRYSRRPGTAAAHLPDSVPASVKERRSTMLRALSMEKRRAFAEQFLGQTLSVLFERQLDGWAVGFSDTYLKVRVPARGVCIRNVVAPTKVVEVAEDGSLIGQLEKACLDEKGSNVLFMSR